MKKEAIIFFIILILLGGALVLTGKPWIGIVLSVMLFYLLLAVLVLILEGRKLSLHVTAEGETEKGQEAGIRLEAENASLMPVARCDVLLGIQNALTGVKMEEKIRFGVLPKKKTICEAGAEDACCGMLTAGIREARLSDPLGLFSKKFRVLPKPAETLVMPQLSKTEIDPDALEHYDMESFRYADGRVGTDSSETVGIRAYREGDSIRAIHWKLSAKQGEIVMKEYGYPVDTVLCVLADKRCTALPEQMDRLTEYAISVSLSLADQEISHTFGWYDGRQKQFVCEEIHTREDVMQILPAFLNAPFSAEANNETQGAALRFLESAAEKRYAGYLYIAENMETEDAGMDRLREFGYVTVLTPEQNA